MEELSQTLAGRAAVLDLLPFSRAELVGQSQEQPQDPRGSFSSSTTKLRLWEAITTGFHPRIHDRGIPPAVWLADYVQTYLT